MKKEKFLVKISLIIHLILINIILSLVLNFMRISNENIDLQELFKIKTYETYWDVSEKIIAGKKIPQR